MRLETRFDIFNFYEGLKQLSGPIGWCSAFAPAEVLVAAGVTPVYPENHAAMMGALSPNRDLSNPYSLPAIDQSLANGLKVGRMCSYALADIGALVNDEQSPIRGLPEPDLFYACDSQCSVVERWGDEVQSIYRRREKEIPHYVLRAPSLVKKEKHSPDDIAGFRAQLEDHVVDIGRRFGTSFNEARLREVAHESNQANRLWQRCLELAKRMPAPWSNTDAFTAMAPIVIARGLPQCTAYYEQLLAELQDRVNNGIAAVPDENVRLIWDAIPIWPRKNWLARFAAERHAVFVASTYTHSWWFSFDPADPMDSLARRYAWNTMNRSTQWILDWTLSLARDYNAHGIVCHWNNSCGIWNSYIKRRLPGYDEAGIPYVVITADMIDARCFDEAAVSRQLGDFIDRLADPARRCDREPEH